MKQEPKTYELQIEKDTRNLIKGLRIAERQQIENNVQAARVLGFFHFGRYPTRDDWESLKTNKE